MTFKTIESHLKSYKELLYIAKVEQSPESVLYFTKKVEMWESELERYNKELIAETNKQ